MQRFTFENKIRSGQSKVFSLRRRCFFSTKYSDELLKVPVLTLGCNLQFFTWQKFVMFADSHQLTESWLQRFDLIKNYANQSGGKFLSRCFHCYYSWRFHIISWKSCLELSIRTLCRRFDVSRTMLRNKLGSVPILKLTTVCGYSKRMWHMHLMINLITSNRFFQLWLKANFFPHNRNCENAKKMHQNSRDFKEPRSFGLTDIFCRLKHLFLTIYLLSRQRTHLPSWKTRNHDLKVTGKGSRCLQR